MVDSQTQTYTRRTRLFSPHWKCRTERTDPYCHP